MIAFWVSAAFLVLGVAAALALPLVASGVRMTGRRGAALAIYKDQLAEVSRDVARGLISADEAAAAEIEIKRRMLAAVGEPAELVAGAHAPDADASEGDASESGGHDAPRARGVRWSLIGLVALVIPLGSVGAYVTLGAPGYTDRPLAARAGEIATVAERARAVLALIDSLETRLADNPGDVKAWTLLAETQRAIGRYPEAASAWAEAAQRAGRPADLLASWGEALTLAAEGRVDDDARRLFEEAVAQDAAEPRARYFLGLERAQAGDLAAAVAIWQALVADAAGDAPWLPRVRGDLAMAQEQMGAQAFTGTPDAAPGPGDVVAPALSAETLRDAENMTAEERAELVGAMVARLAERLEQTPDDAAGWARLARAYEVLGETAKAEAARARAAALNGGADKTAPPAGVTP